MTRILFISAEMAPFSKTGGLGDVSGSLPKALKEIGHEVNTVSPYYHFIPQPMEQMPHEYHVHVSRQRKDGAFLRNREDGVERYFVVNPGYFDREGIYGDRHGEFGDNDERFAYLCEAALLLCKVEGWKPDIIHINDWHTGILAPILRLKYAGDSFFQNTKVVFTIHNLAYHGYFSPGCVQKFDLPSEVMRFDGMEFQGMASFLKAGLQYSDFITTVSPTYAEEIQTREYGFGMEEILRHLNYKLLGILNGIDSNEWNPAVDPHISGFNFNGEALGNKHRYKEYFLSQMGLPYWSHVPLVGMVSRFTPQKGIGLIQESLEEILHMGCQAVILGSGDSGFVDYLHQLQERYSRQLRVFATFSNSLSHQIEAASDYFLMPSRYEPCGLNQMYSLRYGTIPIVHHTGGLADTVLDCDTYPEHGNGYSFYNFNRESFLDAVKRALGLYQYPENKEIIQRRGMFTDYSWSRSAKDYASLYDYLKGE